ncbi:MAG: hypothetical protein WD889_02265 [Candidatus Colwellbacteria bacterium]
MEFLKYDGVPDSIDGVSFEEIYELFAGSSYGKILRQRVRYGPYKQEELSNEDWVRILGPDVNNLEHLKTTLAIANEFIHLARHPHLEWQSGEVNFGPKEEELLCLTAVIHDWGEAVVGDILWHRKTSDIDAEKEFAALTKIVEEICRPRYERLLMEKIYLAANIAFLKGDNALNRVFNAMEHIGYANNVFRAWKERLNYDGMTHQVLSGIAKKLTGDHIATWQRYSKLYPATHYQLLENKKTLEEIQSSNFDWKAVPILANN